MATTAPPWDAWTLNEEFLVKFDKWTKDHPDDKLDIVLAKVCKSIEAGKELTNFISDNCLKGQVGCHELSQQHSSRQMSDHLLQEPGITWIGALVDEKEGWWETLKKKLSLKEQEKGIEQFKSQLHEAKSSFMTQGLILKTIGMLQKEFEQAQEKAHGYQEKEIQEFQSQLDKATSGFEQLSMINLSQAQDLISEGIIMLQKENEQAQGKTHKKIQEAYQKIQKTQETILEQIQNLTGDIQEKRSDEELAFIEQELDLYNAVNSDYCGQDKVFCFQGTRQKFLAEIEEWLFEKSTALQLAKQSTEVAHAMYLALWENPSLMDEDNDTLAEQLFVKPLKFAVNSPKVLVVVDALDEAKNSDILAKILSKMSTCLPTNIKVFVSSQEEDGIQASLANDDIKHLGVGIDEDSTVTDVIFFLQHRIKEIATKHKRSEWPSKEYMEKLCLQTSSLFIWPITAVAYIESQIKLLGSEYLNEAADQLNEGRSFLGTVDKERRHLPRNSNDNYEHRMGLPRKALLKHKSWRPKARLVDTYASTSSHWAAEQLVTILFEGSPKLIRSTRKRQPAHIGPQNK
ncbi:hypothetical protein C8R44DRAFT_749528 [Mycena epipterygia]|nr:hypothetical protein C8R44DRAFT_749528 [Mycena epipterygia]